MHAVTRHHSRGLQLICTKHSAWCVEHMAVRRSGPEILTEIVVTKKRGAIGSKNPCETELWTWTFVAEDSAVDTMI